MPYIEAFKPATHKAVASFEDTVSLKRMNCDDLTESGAVCQNVQTQIICSEAVVVIFCSGNMKCVVFLRESSHILVCLCLQF